MVLSKDLLMHPDQPITSSSIYLGAVILKLFKGRERISIFEAYSAIKKRSKTFSYGNSLYALIFLYVNGIIDFDEPYIYLINKK